MSRAVGKGHPKKKSCTEVRSRSIPRLDATSLVSLLVVLAATAALPAHARLALLVLELLFAASSAVRFRRQNHVSRRPISAGHFCSTTCQCLNPPLEDHITTHPGSFLTPPFDRQLHQQQHQHYQQQQQQQQLQQQQQYLREYPKPRSFPQRFNLPVLRRFHLRWLSGWTTESCERTTACHTGKAAGAHYNETCEDGELRDASDRPLDRLSDEQPVVQGAGEEDTASAALPSTPLDGKRSGFGATKATAAPCVSSEPGRMRRTGAELLAPGAAGSEAGTVDQPWRLIPSLMERTSGMGPETPHTCTTMHGEALPQGSSHRLLDLDTDAAARAELLLTKLLDPREGHLDLLQGGHLLVQWFHGLAGPHQLHVTHIAQLLSYLLLPPPYPPPLPRHSIRSMQRPPCHHWPVPLPFYHQRGRPASPPSAASSPCVSDYSLALGSTATAASPPRIPACSRPGDTGCNSSIAESNATCMMSCSSSLPSPSRRMVSARNEQEQQPGHMTSPTGGETAATKITTTNTTNNNSTALVLATSSFESATLASLSASTLTAPSSTSAASAALPSPPGSSSLSACTYPDLQALALRLMEAIDLPLGPAPASSGIASKDSTCPYGPETGCCPGNRAEKCGVSSALAALSSTTDHGGNSGGFSSIPPRLSGDTPVAPAAAVTSAVPAAAPSCASEILSGCITESTFVAAALEDRGIARPLPNVEATTSDAMTALQPALAEGFRLANKGAIAAVGGWRLTPAFCWGLAVHCWRVGPLSRQSRSRYAAGLGSATAWADSQAPASFPSPARWLRFSPGLRVMAVKVKGGPIGGGPGDSPAQHRSADHFSNRSNSSNDNCRCGSNGLRNGGSSSTSRSSFGVNNGCSAGSCNSHSHVRLLAATTDPLVPSYRPLSFYLVTEAVAGVTHLALVGLMGFRVAGVTRGGTATVYEWRPRQCGIVAAATVVPTSALAEGGCAEVSDLPANATGTPASSYPEAQWSFRPGAMRLRPSAEGSEDRENIKPAHLRWNASSRPGLVDRLVDQTGGEEANIVAGGAELHLAAGFGAAASGALEPAATARLASGVAAAGAAAACGGCSASTSCLEPVGGSQNSAFGAECAHRTLLQEADGSPFRGSVIPPETYDTCRSVASVTDLDDQVSSSSSNSRGSSKEENSDDDTPLVFLHGIGLGLTPYLRLLRRLVLASGGRRAVYAVQYKHVSMRLTATIPAPHEVAADVAAFLAGKGVSRMSLLAHSYGTLVASALTKLAAAAHPSAPRVHHLTLVDPVCFAMFLPHLVRNAIYQQPLPEQLDKYHNHYNHHHVHQRQQAPPWWRRRSDGQQEATAPGSHQPQDVQKQLRETHPHPLRGPGQENTHARPQRVTRECAPIKELDLDTRHITAAAAAGTTGAAAAAEATAAEAITAPVTMGGMTGPWAESGARSADGGGSGIAACAGTKAVGEATAQGSGPPKPRHGPGAALRHQLGRNLLRGLVVGEFHCAVALRRRLDWARVNLWPSELPPQSTVVLGGSDNLVPAREVRRILANRAALLGPSCPHPAVLFREDLGHGAFLTDEDCQAQVVAAALGVGPRQQEAQKSVKRSPLHQAPKPPLTTPHHHDHHHRLHHHQQQQSQTRLKPEQDGDEEEEQQRHGGGHEDDMEGLGLAITGRCGDEGDDCYRSYSSTPLQGAQGEVDSRSGGGCSGGTGAGTEAGYGGSEPRWLVLQRLRSTTSAGAAAPCWPLRPQFLLWVPRSSAARTADPPGTYPFSLEPRVPSGWLGRLIRYNSRPLIIESQGEMTGGGQADKQPHHRHKAEIMACDLGVEVNSLKAARDGSADPNGVTWNGIGEEREEDELEDEVEMEDGQLWNKIGAADAHQLGMREGNRCQQEQLQTGGSASSAWPPSCCNHQLAEVHECDGNLMNHVRGASFGDSGNGGGGGIGSSIRLTGLGDRNRSLPSFPVSRPPMRSQWVAGFWRRPGGVRFSWGSKSINGGGGVKRK